MTSEKTYAANGTQDATADGSVFADFIVSGAFVATVTFQRSRDGGATFQTAAAVNSAGAVVTTATAAGTFSVLDKRPGDILRASVAYTSGAPKVIIKTS